MRTLMALAFLFLLVGTNGRPASAVVMNECGVEVESWLTDTEFRPLCGCTFKVLARGDQVITTNPGGFYYNVLVTLVEDVPDLTIAVTLPDDFVLWGNNPVHVYVNDFDVTGPDDNDAVYAGDSLTFGPGAFPAGTQIFMTVHVRYGLETLPSESYLPKVYTFSATASGFGFSESSSASITGVLKH